MTEKEIKVKYRRALLGFLWGILNPVLQMLVIGFVFQFFVPTTVDNYFLFLFSGILPWNFFTHSITKSTPVIVYERSLIQKTKFPREIIILSIVLSNFIHLLVSLALLLIILVGDKLIFGSYSLLELGLYTWQILGVIPLLIWLLLLTSGIALFTSALNVKYRDTYFMVQAVMPLWFYSTPIVYTLSLIPRDWQTLFYLNPMTAIIEGFHRILLNLPSINSWESVATSLLLSLMIAYMGWWVFRKESKYFDDWV